MVDFQIVIVDSGACVFTAGKQLFILIDWRRRNTRDLLQIILAHASNSPFMEIQSPAQLIEGRNVDLAHPCLHRESDLVGILRPSHGREINFIARSVAPAGIRPCGRAGPARLTSTVDSSSSTVAV